MPTNLVPYQGPGGVITYLQPNTNNPGTAHATDEASSQQQCEHYKSLRDQYIQIDPRWQFWNAAYANCKLLHASGGFDQPIPQPNIGISTAPVTKNPNSYYTNPTAPTVKGDIVSTNSPFDVFIPISKFFATLNGKNSADMWKAIGLLLGAVVLIGIGAIVWLRVPAGGIQSITRVIHE